MPSNYNLFSSSKLKIPGREHLRVLVGEGSVEEVGRLPPRVELVDVPLDNLLEPVIVST